MKKVSSLIALLLVCLAVTVYADEIRPVAVNLNGTIVNCASYGQQATIVDGRTMVPLRAIFEALGADVIWDSETRTALSAKDGVVVSLTVGRAEIVKNGEKVKIDVPALIMNDRTLVPARAVAESFGVGVEWDKDSRTVLLTTVDTSSEITRTGKIESPLDEHHAYGKFYFGMTMQECWNAVEKSDGEAELVSNKDGVNEIHIKVKGYDTGIAEDETHKFLELQFTQNYLFCVKALSQEKNVIRDSTDETVKILLYGREVPNEAKLSAENFLEAFCGFDMREVSLLCTSQNSVRRTEIKSAEDIIEYTGFDKQALVEKAISESFGANEQYGAVAEAMVNSVEKALAKALSECKYGVEKIEAVSENEVEAEFYLSIPDISFVLENGNVIFETVFTEAIEASLADGTLNVSAMSEKDVITAIASMAENLLTQSYLAFFENCPVIKISPKEKLCVVFYDGRWVIDADGDYIKAVLKNFNIFE